MEQTLIEHKCPQCGGALSFDTSSQKLLCPFCGASFLPIELLSNDDGLHDKAASAKQQKQPRTDWQAGEQDGMFVYVCGACGGEVIGDETLAATACPFCGNPVVMQRQFQGDLRPDLVIPFKLDKETAKRAFRNNLKGKRLLPKVFKSAAHIDEIKGVYVPYWLFSADISAKIDYRATRVRSWVVGETEFTETSYYSVLRGGNASFANVPVDGSKKMPDDLMESLEPFDVRDAVDFQTAYLAGYLADRYDQSEASCRVRAASRIKKGAETLYADTVRGYAAVKVQSSRIETQAHASQYALLPVWLLTTKWKGQTYLFAMNGQTGKFVGTLPMDKGAYWRTWALFGALFAAIGVAAVLWLHYGCNPRYDPNDYPTYVTEQQAISPVDAEAIL